MRIGSLVECIGLFDTTILVQMSILGVKPPKFEEIYTIRTISEPNSEGKVYIRLEELVNEDNEDGEEPQFNICGFIEIQEPIEISIEKLLT